VASLPTAQRQSCRHSGRQPKCDGAHSFSDGAVRAERWPSAKT
jgi:CDGSH-type Zn-finger protein